MVFSKEKWATEGIGLFVHSSNALSWETMEGPLLQAWTYFVMPLLGETLCERLTAIFDKEVADRKKAEADALHHVQNAVANLALWYDFTELNTRLTDQGHQRQESENFKSLYKYQEDALRNSYKNKGFNALDALLDCLCAHADVFTEWATCPANVERKERIVRTPKEVDDVVFINRSRIIFLRLQPILKKLEQTQVPVILGQKLHQAFMGNMDKGKASIGTTTVEELRVRVGRVLVNKAVAELIRQTGSLTDRGLYFDTTVAGRDGNEVSGPVNMNEAVKHAAIFERDAREQLQALQNFVSYYVSDLFAGRPEDVFKRDNEDKRTVWL